MTKERHLIAIDLDGTTLTNEQEIHPQTKATLAKLIDDGHIVVIATGRSHRTSIQYYKTLSLKTPMINFNGAYIHHPQNNKWKITHTPLAHDTALNLLDQCYDLKVNNIIAKVENDVYMEKEDEKLIKAFDKMQGKNDFSPFRIGHIKEVLPNGPTSMLIFPEEEDVTKLAQTLDSDFDSAVEHRNWGAPWHITEVTRKGIHKAVGLSKLAKHFDIPQERIIAFGDGDNDLEMIDYAGIGVAMDNGLPELKSIANYVTKTNEDLGVSTFLEDYFKLKVTV